MFLLATLLMGPQSNQRGSTSHGGSDWSWLTGSGRQPRQTSPAATSWMWGYSTKATQPGRQRGWLW